MLNVQNTEKVLKTVLGIYMENATSPLPTFEEVLICNESTTSEEVKASKLFIVLPGIL